MDDGNSSSDDTSDVSDDDLYERKLAPYQFEPEGVGQVDQEETFLDGNATEGRIGKIHWCVCSQCKPMKSEIENLCCYETNEISDQILQG